MAVMKCVVGYQTDEDSEAALELAIYWVQACGGSLVVTVVVPDSWLLAAGADQEFLNDRLEAARMALDRAKLRVASRVEAEYLVLQAASAREGLIEAVRESGASTIVIGSARGGPLERFFGGSLAVELLRDPPCSVLLCPKGHHPQANERLSRLSIAFSGEPASMLAAQQGISLARTLAIPARIVSFIVRNRQMYPSGVGYDAEDAVLNSLKDDIASAQMTLIEGTENTAVIGDGESWDAAVRGVGWAQSELLVITVSRHWWLTRFLLGSNVGKIIYASPVPVLLLPPAEEFSSERN